MEEDGGRNRRMEVFAITSTIGLPTYTSGIPILVEALKETGVDIAAQELTQRQKEVKERFRETRGYWTQELENMLKLDPEMFESFLDYSDAFTKNGVLSPRMKELLYIAVNASPTALNQEAMGFHIRKALSIGVTKEEIVEVFELVACLGIHSVMVGIPILNEALKDRETSVTEKTQI